MANLSLLGLSLHWTASVEHRQYCRLIIWIYLVAALVPVSEEVCRSVDVYQRGKLLTLELKTGTLLKLGVRFKVTLVVVNLLWNIGNVIWVEAYHYFQVILLIIGGNFIHKSCYDTSTYYQNVLHFAKNGRGHPYYTTMVVPTRCPAEFFKSLFHGKMDDWCK